MIRRHPYHYGRTNHRSPSRRFTYSPASYSTSGVFTRPSGFGSGLSVLSSFTGLSAFSTERRPLTANIPSSLFGMSLAAFRRSPARPFEELADSSAFLLPRSHDPLAFFFPLMELFLDRVESAVSLRVVAWRHEYGSPIAVLFGDFTVPLGCWREA